jgi:D-sedoheptulose 7-phosphate isomerase
MDIKDYFDKHLAVVGEVGEQHADTIVAMADTICACLAAGGKLLVMGNGGSAADAQHFAAEMVGRFRKERAAIPAVALTTDSSILTALGNDYGFERVFVRQIEALAAPADVVLGLSTSGRSQNVLLALEQARRAGCATLGLLGCDGGAIAAVVDVALVVPSTETPHVQEAHITIIHLLCAMIESRVACGA